MTTALVLLLAVARAATGPDAGPEAPLRALPYSPSLDVAAMDTSVDACQDFYAYSCGGWIKANPIPADRSSWSVYSKLTQDNELFLWGILDDAAKPAPGRTDVQQKIGDYYAACMNEPAIEAQGATPLKPWLDRIAALTSVAEVAPLAADSQAFSDSFLFGFGAQPSYTDSSQMIAVAGAGGLGLPDRDYYTRTDAKSKELQQQYLKHVQAMLQLLGDSAAVAATEAKTVYRIEGDLARASLTNVQRRDPHNLAHTLTLAQLHALAPAFDWAAFFTEVGLPGLASLNVEEPKFEQQLQKELTHTSLADWKTYLRWHLVHALAPYLSTPFVTADFEFYRHTLRGVPSLRPRWKRCVEWTDEMLGEALGQEFVRRTFTDDTKSKAADMTQRIEKAMEADLQGLTWMGPKTREEALAKLHAMRNKIGFPDHWRDYSTLTIAPGDFVGNVARAQSFELKRTITKVGKPVDRSEWFMSPPTVNAYYDDQFNDMNFPAGVLQPPLFDVKLDDAPNYGNTGSTIGHELTHGFDDNGRKYDSKGNLRDWWDTKDGAAFEKRAQCVVSQYGKYPVVDELKINSKLSEGEDIADLGGTVLAYAAWKKAEEGKTLESREGFTPEQRFFIGLAQWACENQRPENLRLNALTNPHSPGRYRINGVVANLPEFGKAFSCQAGSPMVNPKPCQVW